MFKHWNKLPRRLWNLYHWRYLKADWIDIYDIDGAWFCREGRGFDLMTSRILELEGTSNDSTMNEGVFP